MIWTFHLKVMNLFYFTSFLCTFFAWEVCIGPAHDTFCDGCPGSNVRDHQKRPGSPEMEKRRYCNRKQGRVGWRARLGCGPTSDRLSGLAGLTNLLFCTRRARSPKTSCRKQTRSHRHGPQNRRSISQKARCFSPWAWPAGQSIFIDQTEDRSISLTAGRRSGGFARAPCSSSSSRWRTRSSWKPSPGGGWACRRRRRSPSPSTTSSSSTTVHPTSTVRPKQPPSLKLASAGLMDESSEARLACRGAGTGADSSWWGIWSLAWMISNPCAVIKFGVKVDRSQLISSCSTSCIVVAVRS